MDFNNWIRKLFFFFSMNPVYKFVDRSNFLFLQPPKLFHEYHQLDKKKKNEAPFIFAKFGINNERKILYSSLDRQFHLPCFHERVE